MTDLTRIADVTVDALMTATWQSAILVAIVLLVDATLLRRADARWRFAIWSLVLVRLALPALPASPWSLFNAIATIGSIGSSQAEAPPQVRLATSSIAVSVAPASAPTREVPADAVAPRSAIAATFTPRTTAFCIWIVGVTVCLARAFGASFLLWRRLRRGATPPARAVELLRETARAVRVNSRVRLVVTDAVSGPSLCGLSRPRLLVPPALLAELTREELRLVFLHELAHVRRRDVAIEWLIAIVRAVHWFNPLAWLAMARLREYRELAADATVLRGPAAPSRGAYGSALLRVVERIGAPRSLTPVLISMATDRSQLQRRIRMIATNSPTARPLVPALLFLLIAGCTLTGARPTDRPSTSVSVPPVEGAPPAKPVPVVAADASDARDPSLVKLLEARLPTVTFDATPLDAVIESLREMSGANLFVNWRALETAGISRTAPVTVRLRDVSLGKALDVILNDAGGGSVQLMHAAQENVIVISTREDLEVMDVTTRAYDIRDLIITVPDFRPNERTDEGRVPEPSRAELIEQIVSLIQTSVATETWRANAGRVGSISDLNGTLIVRTTSPIQQQVAALLEQLREQRNVNVTIESRFISLDPQRLPADLRAALLPAFGGKVGAVTIVNEQQVDQLMRQVEASATKPALNVTADVLSGAPLGGGSFPVPRITLFSGQRAYSVIATERSYVAAYELKATDAKPLGEPTAVMQTAQASIVLDVQATVSSDRKQVTLNLRPKLTSLIDLTDVPFTLLPGHPDLRVEQPELLVRRLESTISVPDRATAMVSGFTVDGAARLSEESGQFFLLLVKPTIHVHQDVGPAPRRN